MKLFLIILSLSFTINAFAQQNSTLGKNTTPANYDKDTVVKWQDVVAFIGDTSKTIPKGIARGEGIIDKRRKVHSPKDLNKRELKKIKKEAAWAGATVVYIWVDKMNDTDWEVYYYYVFCTKSEIKKATFIEIK